MVEEPAVRGEEEEEGDEDAVEVTPLSSPPPPLARPAHRVPPAREAPAPPPPPGTGAPGLSDSISSQWELPSIPSASLDLGMTSPDLSASWIEADAPGSGTVKVKGTASTGKTVSAAGAAVPAQGTVKAPPKARAEPPRLSADELMAVWGRVGVQVCEMATMLHGKSKRTLIGDGTYAGFVHAVLNEVPNALRPGESGGATGETWGHLVYSQTGNAVQRRTSEIMPGDVVELLDARLKGHKGLQAYHQHVGVAGEEPLVGIVSEVDPKKKSKVRVFQANQHVGQQTVEAVSYRLEDLKSGTVRVSCLCY
ncbi:hypothetical protein AMATHDRAFT_143054 [Amanita thiersii Skay4041]|uniref:BBC1/AIM3 cysteine proteinase-fold domain-containing protein n=1 Tax=Amanita thiersii Skay4041 TaxID=703135 RepID=A0A2A9NU41_9AGAR|nr:hypothetical protein AMATHDRAFT_143054 [Amanita thiersii Skay4041]